MTLVEVTEPSDQPNVSVTEQATQATVSADAAPSAVEVPADASTAVISGDPSVVEVQVPVASQIVTGVQTTEIVEIQVPAASTVALPVDDEPEVVQLIVQGPQGPTGVQGPEGPQGAPGITTVVGNLSFIWTQNTPSDTWLIEHDLGFFPAVSVVDSGSNVVEGSVHYIDDNNIQVTFALPFGGTAYLS